MTTVPRIASSKLTKRRCASLTLMGGFLMSLFLGLYHRTGSILPQPQNNERDDASNVETRPISKQSNVLTEVSSSNRVDVNIREFQEVLSRHADQSKVIILALTDSSFLDMTLNFYETSLEKFNINNYLFISSDSAACKHLQTLNIHCYVYMTDENASIATTFGTKQFKQKMNIRTFMISDALNMGFTVLHTDVDIVFLKNPLLDIRCGAGCDITGMLNTDSYNAGFVYVRPTEISMAIYKQMITFALTINLNDQRCLNKAMNYVNKTYKELGQPIGAEVLPKKKYMSGMAYFEQQDRNSLGEVECPECVIVHNNFIMTLEAKRCRFREFRLWVYDGNRYYSDPSRKYLTYEIPSDFDPQGQLSSLKAALFFGEVLHRTVILPRAGSLLYNLVNMSAFDKFFDGKYRESSFLSHPKVPDAVHSPDTGLGTLYWLTNKTNFELKTDKKNIVLKFSGSDGPSRAQILEMFGEINVPVLRIGWLWHLYDNPGVRNDEPEFKNVLSQVF